MERALVLVSPGQEIDLTELSDKVADTDAPTTAVTTPGTLRHAIEAVERAFIARANETFKGNKTQMADKLGISRWSAPALLAEAASRPYLGPMAEITDRLSTRTGWLSRSGQGIDGKSRRHVGSRFHWRGL